MALFRIDCVRRLARLLGLAGLLLTMAAGIGCGSVTKGNNNFAQNSSDPLNLGGDYGPLGSPNPSTLELRLGSAPSDRIVSLSLTLDSLNAHPSGTPVDNSIQMLTAPVTFEFTHTATVTEPISLRDIYQDTYDGLVFPAMTGSVTFYDNTGQLVVQAISVPAQTVPYGFVLGTSPMVLSVSVDLAQSFTITDSGNTRPMLQNAGHYQPYSSSMNTNTLVVTAESNTPNPAVGQPESGSITFLVGTATSVNSGSKTIAIQPASGDATQVSYSDSGANATDFENCTPSTLTGMLLEVAAVTQADGSILATEVEWAGNSTGSQLYGLLSGYNPSGFFAMVVEGGEGANVTSSLVGKKITVDWLDAIYAVNDGGLIDMSTTDLSFDSGSVYPGQLVEVEWDTLIAPDSDLCPGPCNAGILQPGKVELEQQTITGTVSGLAYNPLTQTGSFTLNLASNAALRIQNPGLAVDGTPSIAGAITVNQVSKTFLKSLPTGFANGNTVKVRGLLFSTTPNGGYVPSPSNPVNFVLVAGRISK